MRFLRFPLQGAERVEALVPTEARLPSASGDFWLALKFRFQISGHVG